MALSVTSRKIRGSIVNARDPVYNSLWLRKYIGMMAKDGHRERAERQQYKVLRALKLFNPFPSNLAPVPGHYITMPHAASDPPATTNKAAIARQLFHDTRAAAEAKAAADAGTPLPTDDEAKAKAIAIKQVKAAARPITSGTSAPIIAMHTQTKAIDYAALHVHPLLPFFHMMQSLHMMIGFHPAKSGGRTFLVPYTLDPYNQYRKPLGWFVRHVRDMRRSEPVEQRAEREIRSILKKKSPILQKKMEAYKRALETRNLMHFRWLF